MQKNLEIEFSILDLIFSILEIEFSILDLEKSIPNLEKNNPNFRQFFVKNFAKKSVLKFWQNKSDFPIF